MRFYINMIDMGKNEARKWIDILSKTNTDNVCYAI